MKSIGNNRSKNLGFFRRASFAVSGWHEAFRSEASFRVQTAAAAAAISFLFVTRPEPIWWAAVFLTTGSVLALELLNTSLEHLIDRLHPEKHESIRIAKDCAAGAVLIMSVVSLGVFAALCAHLFASQ